MVEKLDPPEKSAAPIRRITDPEEVRKLFKVRPGYEDIEEWLIQMIAESGAILEGHFELSEGDADMPIETGTIDSSTTDTSSI